MFSYIYNGSFLQTLNPIFKVLATAIISSTLIYFNDNIHILFFFALPFILILFLGKISFFYLISIIKPFLLFFIFIFIIRVIFNSEGRLSIPNSQMLLHGAINTLNFIFIFLFSAILSFASTSPSKVTRAFYFFIKPFEPLLKRADINKSDIAISILIAVRFFPLIFAEADKIIKSQKLRNIYKRTNLLKLELFLIPLFNRVFFYANEMALTISMRGDITELELPKPRSADFIFLTMVILYSISFIIGFHYGFF